MSFRENSSLRSDRVLKGDERIKKTSDWNYFCI